MSTPKPHHRLRLASFATIAIMALFALPGTATAASVDSKAAQYVKHTLECLNWLLTDPAMHTANCTPSRPFSFPDQGSPEPKTISLVSTGAWTDSCEEEGQECEEEPPCVGTGPGCEEEEEPPCTTEDPYCECAGTEEECFPI